MLEPFLVRIITPKKMFYSGHADAMVAPGADGLFGVFPNHAPLMTQSSGGRLKIREAQKEERFFKIGPGFIEVEENEVIILTKEAEELHGVTSLIEPRLNIPSAWSQTIAATQVPDLE